MSDKMHESELLPTHTLTWLTENLFEISVEHGELVASYYHELGKMLITNLDVSQSFRRQGIGKNLLRIAKEQAVELGATAIWAAVVSRESIDTMVGVFGEEAVTIEVLGKYEQHRLPPHRQTGTRAWLYYELNTKAD